uniref:Uncharacterized protein n=1 Tax=Bartonella schoenbuchensis (strain DSM 13525 / NCTC 13165 / R1) TaxID=687861 RepID=E6YY26_BARSR|nr:hypothetical protein B11C_20114 [Bartonella schoenbuchensis R1]
MFFTSAIMSIKFFLFCSKNIKESIIKVFIIRVLCGLFTLNQATLV